MVKSLLKAKRMSYAKKLGKCRTDEEVKMLVLSSGKTHANEVEGGWIPCIGQFLIYGDGNERWSFTSQVDAIEKARDLNRVWKNEVNK